MKWNAENVWLILRTNDDQLGRALVALYARQTEDEQEAKVTGHSNGLGFNSVDAPFLSSVAESFNKYGRLTEKQADAVRKCIKKYLRQLVDIANQKVGEKNAEQVEG